SSTSRKPSVVSSAVRAPRRSSRAFVATVVPWAKTATSPPSTPTPSRADRTPTDWSLVVDGTFATRSSPLTTATRSVNVPPTSTPIREPAGADSAAAIGARCYRRTSHSFNNFWNDDPTTTGRRGGVTASRGTSQQLLSRLSG